MVQYNVKPAIQEVMREIHPLPIGNPILPMNPDAVCERIRPYADHVYIDRMNYATKTKELYHRFGRSQWLERDHIDEIMERLRKGLGRERVTLC